MRPIDQLKTNDQFFEQMQAQEQAFCRNPYISRYGQIIHTLIGAEVVENLRAEKTEKVTAVLNAATQTMRTELQES